MFDRFCRRRFIITIILLGYIAGSSAGAATVSEAGKGLQQGSDGSRTCWADALLDLPGEGMQEAYRTYSDPDNLMLLLMAGGGSIALQDRADGTIARHFDEHRALSHDFDKLVDWTGSPVTHFAAAALWYVISADRGDEFNRQRSWALTKSLVVTGTTTVLLKAINNNHTPNGKNFAWPSGHTASSFCVASVLDEFYGPKVGLYAYGLAGFVGYRMMDSGDHWASDVLFGAVLGYVVGHSVAGEHKKIEVAGFDVLPYVSNIRGRSVMGISVAKEF